MKITIGYILEILNFIDCLIYDHRQYDNKQLMERTKKTIIDSKDFNEIEDEIEYFLNHYNIKRIENTVYIKTFNKLKSEFEKI